ncbi:MAG: hypothetical protein ACQET1_02665 [Gemmatimonadota bacterium]
MQCMRQAHFRIGPDQAGTRSLTGVLCTLLLTGTLAVAACNPFDIGTERFIIAVDTMSVPESVAAGDTLVARFRGWIGPDLCSRLDRVERDRGPHQITLRFRGARRVEGDCAHMPALLDHAEAIAPPLEDPFTIRVLQPDGTSLEREVRVRQGGGPGGVARHPQTPAPHPVRLDRVHLAQESRHPAPPRRS